MRVFFFFENASAGHTQIRRGLMQPTSRSLPLHEVLHQEDDKAFIFAILDFIFHY